MKQFKTITTAVLLIFLFCLTESHGFLEDTCDATRNPNNCNDQLRHYRTKDERFTDAQNRRVSEPDLNRVTTRRTVRSADRDADIPTGRSTNRRQFREIRQVRSVRDLSSDRRMEREDFNDRRLNNRETMERNTAPTQRQIMEPRQNTRDASRQERRITERTPRRTAEESRTTTPQTRKQERSTLERTQEQNFRANQRFSDSTERLLQRQMRATEDQERRIRNNQEERRSFEMYRNNRRSSERNSDRRLHERDTRADQERTSIRRTNEHRNAADTIKTDRRVSQRNKDISQLRRMYPEERVLQRTTRRVYVEQRRTNEPTHDNRRVAERKSEERHMPDTREVRLSDRSTRNTRVRENQLPVHQEDSRRTFHLQNRVRITRETTERINANSRATRNAHIDANINRRVSGSRLSLERNSRSISNEREETIRENRISVRQENTRRSYRLESRVRVTRESTESINDDSRTTRNAQVGAGVSRRASNGRLSLERRTSNSRRVNNERKHTIRENRMPVLEDDLRRSYRLENQMRFTRETTQRMTDDIQSTRNARVDTNRNRRVLASTERRSPSDGRLSVERETRDFREARQRNNDDRRAFASIERRSISASRLDVEHQARNSRAAFVRSHRVTQRNAAGDLLETVSNRRSEGRTIDNERAEERRNTRNTERVTQERVLKSSDQERRQAIRESSAAVNRVLQISAFKDENNNERSRRVTADGISANRFDDSGRRMAISSRVVEQFAKPSEHFGTSGDYWMTAAKTFLATVLIAQVLANSKPKKCG